MRPTSSVGTSLVTYYRTHTNSQFRGKHPLRQVESMARIAQALTKGNVLTVRCLQPLPELRLLRIVVWMIMGDVPGETTG
jgi:hypothetical protein